MAETPIAPSLPDLSGLSLTDVAQMVAEKRLPPVDKWNPTHCGHSDMRIARDGTWFHKGSPIGRMAMVRLFSTILRREPDGGHVLVTPVEKLDIDVEDTPFIAIAVKSEGDGPDRTLAFTTNVGDRIAAGPENGIRMAGTAQEPRPYLHVRAGLEALIDRKTFYRLAEIAETDQETGRLALRSNGQVIALEP